MVDLNHAPKFFGSSQNVKMAVVVIGCSVILTNGSLKPIGIKSNSSYNITSSSDIASNTVIIKASNNETVFKETVINNTLYESRWEKMQKLLNQINILQKIIFGLGLIFGFIILSLSFFAKLPLYLAIPSSFFGFSFSLFSFLMRERHE